MKKIIFTASALVGLSLSTVGCSHYSQEEGEKLSNQVYALSTQLQALQKSMREQQKLGEDHSEQIDSNTTQVNSLSRAARRNDADLGVQVDNLMQQMGELRGLVETTKDRSDEIDAEINRLKDENKVNSAKSEEEKQQAIAAAREREQLLSNPTALITEVKARLEMKKPIEARALLQEFKLRSKNNPAFSRYQAHAQYLVGETFYAEGDFKRAATEYNAVRKKYSKSKYVPDALYKMGRCFENLKLPEDAKLFYQTLRRQYKKSAASKKAKERLKKLGK